MDPRDRQAQFGKWYDSFDRQKMTVFVEALFDRALDDEMSEADATAFATFRVKFEVCGLCEGRGTHVNPSIDAHGISAEEFDDDPDFREEYFRGTYDVACYRCGGQNVEPVVDDARCTEAQLEAIRSLSRDRAQYQREVEAERRAGC